MLALRGKRWIYITLLLLLTIITCMGVQKHLSYSNEVIVKEGEIVKITLPDKGFPILTIYDGTEKYGIFIQEDTEVVSSTDKAITLSDLSEGQRIRVSVGADVIYEPYDTFVRCYQITIL